MCRNSSHSTLHTQTSHFLRSLSWCLKCAVWRYLQFVPLIQTSHFFYKCYVSLSFSLKCVDTRHTPHFTLKFHTFLRILMQFEFEFEVCSVALFTIRSPNSTIKLFWQMLNWFEFECEVCRHSSHSTLKLHTF